MSPFAFDKDYNNSEQVRPYFADYCAVRADLIASGRGSESLCYNADFKGRIASLAGTDDKNEDTAIYLLQRMHGLDALAVTVAEFKASGGVDADTIPIGEQWRGTVARYGWYMGGTGWQAWEGARLARDGRGFVLIQKGKRNGGRLDGHRLMIREAN